jgi:hypothetical protein
MAFFQPFACSLSVFFSIGNQNRMAKVVLVKKKPKDCTSSSIISTKSAILVYDLSRIVIIGILWGWGTFGFDPHTLFFLPAPIRVSMCDQKHPIRSGSRDVQELLEISFAFLVDRSLNLEIQEFLEHCIGTLKGHFEELAQKCLVIGYGRHARAGLFWHFGSPASHNYRGIQNES